MNKELIAIHQDDLGQQAVCTQNCDMETNNGTIQTYQQQIMINGEAFITVMAVNWEDDGTVAPVEVYYDFVAHSISFSKYDNCYMIDLWGGPDAKAEALYGSTTYSLGTVGPHGNVAKKINCSPF
jgi:hypothetical protein